MKNFFSLITLNYIIFTIINDAPESWQLGFQDNASPGMEGIIELHNDIFYFLIIISLAVFWILGLIIYFFNNIKSPIVHKYWTHGTLIELIWTITPAIILMFIAQPSFSLLYILDEVISPTMTIKAVGHQWYWSFEYTDYETAAGDPIEFDSYMVPETDLDTGQLRLLEVDNKVNIPVDTHIRVVVQSTDVIHDLAVPSLGVKIDAIPGRLNQTSLIAEREGNFYGQCSEICGVYHGFMPVSVEALPLFEYLSWLNSAGLFLLIKNTKKNWGQKINNLKQQILIPINIIFQKIIVKLASVALFARLQSQKYPLISKYLYFFIKSLNYLSIFVGIIWILHLLAWSLGIFQVLYPRTGLIGLFGIVFNSLEFLFTEGALRFLLSILMNSHMNTMSVTSDNNSNGNSSMTSYILFADSTDKGEGSSSKPSNLPLINPESGQNSNSGSSSNKPVGSSVEQETSVSTNDKNGNEKLDKIANIMYAPKFSNAAVLTTRETFWAKLSRIAYKGETGSSSSYDPAAELLKVYDAAGRVSVLNHPGIINLADPKLPQAFIYFNGAYSIKCPNPDPTKTSYVLNFIVAKPRVPHSSITCHKLFYLISQHELYAKEEYEYVTANYLTLKAFKYDPEFRLDSKIMKELGKLKEEVKEDK